MKLRQIGAMIMRGNFNSALTGVLAVVWHSDRKPFEAPPPADSHFTLIVKGFLES